MRGDERPRRAVLISATAHQIAVQGQSISFGRSEISIVQWFRVHVGRESNATIEPLNPSLYIVELRSIVTSEYIGAADEVSGATVMMRMGRWL